MLWNMRSKNVDTARDVINSRNRSVIVLNGSLRHYLSQPSFTFSYMIQLTETVTRPNWPSIGEFQSIGRIFLASPTALYDVSCLKRALVKGNPQCSTTPKYLEIA